MEELSFKSVVEQFSKVTDVLTCDKALDDNGILSESEITKCEKSVLLEPVHKLLCLAAEKAKSLRIPRFSLYKSNCEESLSPISMNEYIQGGVSYDQITLQGLSQFIVA